MVTILATTGKTAEFINADTYPNAERIAESKGYSRYEDALGGVFLKIRGEWVFICQKKAHK